MSNRQNRYRPIVFKILVPKPSRSSFDEGSRTVQEKQWTTEQQIAHVLEIARRRMEQAANRNNRDSDEGDDDHPPAGAGRAIPRNRNDGNDRDDDDGPPAAGAAVAVEQHNNDDVVEGQRLIAINALMDDEYSHTTLRELIARLTEPQSTLEMHDPEQLATAAPFADEASRVTVYRCRHPKAGPHERPGKKLGPDRWWISDGPRGASTRNIYGFGPVPQGAGRPGRPRNNANNDPEVEADHVPPEEEVVDPHDVVREQGIDHDDGGAADMTPSVLPTMSAKKNLGPKVLVTEIEDTEVQNAEVQELEVHDEEVTDATEEVLAEEEDLEEDSSTFDALVCIAIYESLIKNDSENVGVAVPASA